MQVTNYETLPDGRLLIDTKGCERIRVLNERVVNGLTNVRFEFYRDLPVEEEDSESEALIYFKHFTVVGSCGIGDHLNYLEIPLILFG